MLVAVTLPSNFNRQIPEPPAAEVPALPAPPPPPPVFAVPAPAGSLVLFPLLSVPKPPPPFPPAVSPADELYPHSEPPPPPANQ